MFPEIIASVVSNIVFAVLASPFYFALYHSKSYIEIEQKVTAFLYSVPIAPISYLLTIFHFNIEQGIFFGIIADSFINIVVIVIALYIAIALLIRVLNKLSRMNK